MKTRYSQIYENTEILSPIDRATWEVIGDTSELGPSSRVIELASGKGAFARFLATRHGCRIDGFDSDLDFVEYAKERVVGSGLSSLVNIHHYDVNNLESRPAQYDLGVCLGSLYIFRDKGWKILTESIKPSGYLAISDIFCKQVPAHNAVMKIFFEEEGQPFTLQDLRGWYTERGFDIIREEQCSREAWLEYYDLKRLALESVAKEYVPKSPEHAEIKEAEEEDRVFREYGEKFVGYMTFILKRC